MFRPTLEALETRETPAAIGGYSGSHALYQDVYIPAADGNVIYVTTAGGGVWKGTAGAGLDLSARR